MKVAIIGIAVLIILTVAVVWLNRQQIHKFSHKSQEKYKIEYPNQAELGWIEDNLRKAREFVGKEKDENIELKELDDAFAKWLDTNDPENEDPNPFINVFGIAFGQYLVDQLGLKWMVVTDRDGTEMAVYGQPGDILVFPTNFVAKRYVNKQKEFFSLFYPEMKKDIEQLTKIRNNSLMILSFIRFLIKVGN